MNAADRVRDDVRSANLEVYADGSAVDSYVHDTYHRVRRELTGELLDRARRSVAGPPAYVLELGTGPRSIIGGGSIPVIAADIAFAAVASTREPGIDGVCLDAADLLPFADGSLAGVVAGELVEHLYDPVRLVEECHRVLRPGGVLVLTTPNLANLQDRVRFLWGISPRHVDPLHPYLRLHIRPFTESALRRVLHDTGFDQITVRSNFVVWRFGSRRWVKFRTLARLRPGLGGSLVVSALKRVDHDK